MELFFKTSRKEKMMDYCRLCAELKDPCEIVTSISDAEQLIEEKLRVCCQWTTETTEQRLPHKVCAICLEKLDKCWLFSQSVQLAQQKLHEIFENGAESETNPLTSQTVINSEEYSIHSPSISNAQSNRLNHKTLRDRSKQKTIPDSPKHRQEEGCEGLIKIKSFSADCKPTSVDSAHFECDIMTDKNQAIDDDLDADGPMKHFRIIMNRMTRPSNYANGKRTYDCRLCKKSYTAGCSLKRHLITHVQNSNELKIKKTNDKFWIIRKNGGNAICIGRDLYECESCNRIFSLKSEFDIHRQNHSTERPFECSLCHKTFKTRVAIKTHMKIHIPDENRRNAVCELCGKFFTETQRSLHMKTVHSNERPYKCETCGAKFKLKSRLKRHRSTHTESQQFKCNQCERAYRTKHSLKCHLELVHTGVVAKPFVCDFCGIGFRRNMDLKDHRRIHTGEKPFACEQCSSNFGARSSYYTHLRKVHGISLLARNKEKLAE